MAAKTGKDCKISLGANKISLMGTWSMPGVTTELLEDTEFGDEWKTYKLGLKDGGQITFNGLYDPTDSSGQDALRTANLNGTELTDIRLYIDDNSYWVPTTTNPASFALVTDWEVSADKNGLMTASFTAKISGYMHLV